MTSPDYQWVASLTQRYEAATQHPDSTDNTLLDQLPTLRLAKAALDKAHLTQEYPSHTEHLVVLGPTQSGKSSLVNVLLDTQAASVSPLAGFTVHSQGYARTISDNDIACVNRVMAPLSRTPAQSLDADNLSSYVLETVATTTRNLAGSAIVWDTPDFDSITATRYSLSVLKAAALSDVVLLVVSKDKYGDQRVWDMLALLNDLQKPLLVCINKIDDADRAIVQNAFNTRYLALFDQAAPDMLMLPFVKTKDRQQRLSFDRKTTKELKAALSTLSQRAHRSTALSCATRFADKYQEAWLQPLVSELDASDQWKEMIDTAVNDAEAYYVQHYLNNSDKYETFNRALAELLTLLEIPGVAATLTQARKIITWPARRLLDIGKQSLSKSPEPPRDSNGVVMDQEALALQHMLDRVIVGLQRMLSEAPTDPWWQALGAQMRIELPLIRRNYATSSDNTRQSFEPEVEKAAARLYEQLKERPTLLNTLRAARATGDAAGVALAFKSGGLAPTDLILAPAMLSVTSLLTEGALGKYLDTVKRDLKVRQQQHIKTQLLEKTLKALLTKLSAQLSHDTLLSSDMDETLTAQLVDFRRRKNAAGRSG